MAFPISCWSGYEMSASVHKLCYSGDDRVGLIGQHLLSLIDCVNPCGFYEVQIAVLHQRVFKGVVPPFTGHHKLHLLCHVFLDHAGA